jgi:tRNA-specific 2-thiouridylase
VQGKDVARNVIYVAHADRVATSQRGSFEVEPLHWIGDPPKSREVLTRVRHGGALQAAALECAGERGRVRLETGDRGIAPGQFAVFYEGEVCLGGAAIAA